MIGNVRGWMRQFFDAPRGYTPFMPEEFRGIKFDGGRYKSSDGFPLDSIDELRRFQNVLSGVARELFFRDHPSRERVSKQFREALVLKLVGIGEGSVVTLMNRPEGETDETLDGTGSTGYFDRSFGLIARSIDALSKSQPLPADFPEDVVPALLQLGRSFRGDESLLLDHDGSWRTYNRSARHHLQRLAQVGTLESERVITGTLTGLNTQPKQSFAFKPVGADQPLSGEFDPAMWDDLYESFDIGERAPLIALSAVIREDAEGQILSVAEVLGIDQALPTLWASRLQEISKLADGWFDGGGSAVTEEALSSAEDVLLRAFDAGAPRPGIFPTPNGGLRIEWEKESSGLILDVDPQGEATLDELFDDTEQSHLTDPESIESVFSQWGADA